MLSFAAQAAETSAPQLRVEGSFPVQYVETVTNTAHNDRVMVGPFLRMMATSQLQPGLYAAAFAEGGSDPLGRFRDNDTTFASVGGDVFKRWGAFSAGVGLEHTYFYTRVFERAPNVVNGVNVFARYAWTPNADLRITPSVRASIRFDDQFVLQRYLYTARMEIEQRLVGSWWFIATPRFRYSEGVSSTASRRDVTVAILSGLKYQFTENVSFTTLVGYENRATNVASRNFDRYVIGASLDYRFSPRLPW